jgi:hypothetical protein
MSTNNYNTMLRIVLILLLFHQIVAWNKNNYINLQNIVISSAVMTTITKRINSEIINETIVMSDITNIKSHTQQINIILDSLLVLLLVTQYKTAINYDQKFVNIDLYSETQKSTNIFILIMLFVFTRNVENAI